MPRIFKIEEVLTKPKKSVCGGGEGVVLGSIPLLISIYIYDSI